jgi:hypothetical protein
MESVYHIVAIRVNETSWAHVWRLRSHYLRTGYDTAWGLPSAGWRGQLLGLCLSGGEVHHQDPVHLKGRLMPRWRV